MDALLEAWEEVEGRCEKDTGEVPAHVQRILAPASGKHTVVEIRGGGRDGEAVTLSDPVTLIGRSRLRCALPLNDTQVSRVHLKVVREEGEAYAFDMGSHNGTFVGSQQVRAVRLTEGLEVRIGGCVLRFL
jgi:pSer/pThr/pTyr-binding forkhead associated (FHA) protein